MQHTDASESNLHLYYLFKKLITITILIYQFLLTQNYLLMNSFMKIIYIGRMPKTDFVHRFNK